MGTNTTKNLQELPTVTQWNIQNLKAVDTTTMAEEAAHPLRMMTVTKNAVADLIVGVEALQEEALLAADLEVALEAKVAHVNH